MTPNVEINNELPELRAGLNESAKQHRLEAAREAGNTWKYGEIEVEMFVARGEIRSATEILNPSTKESTGATMIHQFGWTDGKPFINREGAFKTSLARVGRATKQKVKTTQSIPVNAALYSNIIQSGVIRVMKNGEEIDTPISKDEMLEFARLYPESASEAIDVWLESPKFKVIDDYGDDFKWIFTHTPVKRVLMYIGEEENPLVAGIFTFNSPSKEEREQFDDEVQNLDTDRKGEMNFAELSENFKAKVSFGLKHFKSVEGIAFGEEGKTFTGDESIKEKERFIILFNPIWFVEALETMLDSFAFTKGKSKTA